MIPAFQGKAHANAGQPIRRSWRYQSWARHRVRVQHHESGGISGQHAPPHPKASKGFLKGKLDGSSIKEASRQLRRGTCTAALSVIAGCCPYPANRRRNATMGKGPPDCEGDTRNRLGVGFQNASCLPEPLLKQRTVFFKRHRRIRLFHPGSPPEQGPPSDPVDFRGSPPRLKPNSTIRSAR